MRAYVPDPGPLKKSGRASASSGRTTTAVGQVAIAQGYQLAGHHAARECHDDQNAEYLSDGITESIINNLSQLPNCEVMARSTVFRYKGQQSIPCEVGRALACGQYHGQSFATRRFAGDQDRAGARR